MDNRKRMIHKARKILDHLNFAKEEADSFVYRFPDSVDKRIRCVLWHEKFSSVLRGEEHEKGKRGRRVLRRILILMVNCISAFLGSAKLPKDYEVDFLFLYNCSVHRDIVKELVSRFKEDGLRVLEIETSLSKTERIANLIKAMKYTLIDEDIRSLPLSEKSYQLFMHWLGMIVPHMPKIVISFNESSRAAGLIAYICKLIGSKSVNIAHSISARTPLFLNSPYDYHLVYGEKSKKNIEGGKGIIDGKIIPIGALRMDKFFPASENTNPFTKKILIVGSWKGHFLDEVVDYMYALLSEFVRTRKDLIFMYKPHPLEVGDKSSFSKKFYGMSNCTVLPASSDLLKVLESVDVVLLGWSAAGLEAAIRGKPIIVVNPCRVPDWLSYVESGYGVEISSIEELNSALTKIYDNYDYYVSRAKEFVDIHLSNQGGATAEAYRFLLTILREYEGR